MNLALLLQMAADGMGGRTALGPRTGGLSYQELYERARRVASRTRPRIAHLGLNSPALPLLLFGGARAGVPLVPLNYRLAPERLAAILRRIAPATVVTDAAFAPLAEGVAGITAVAREEFMGRAGPGLEEVSQ